MTSIFGKKLFEQTLVSSHGAHMYNFVEQLKYKSMKNKQKCSSVYACSLVWKQEYGNTNLKTQIFRYIYTYI